MKYLIIATIATLGLIGLFAHDATAQSYRSFSDRIGTDYIGINIGSSYQQESDFNFSTGNNVETEYETGVAFTGEVGHNYGRYGFVDNVKLGVEVGYSGADVDEHQLNGSTTLAGSGGELHATTVMANMYHEYDTRTPFVPYYGVGVGGAYINADNFRTNATGQALDDDDVAFAYQGTAGVNYILTENADIGVRYRFTGTEGAEMQGSGSNADKEDFDLRNHSVGVNFSYNF